MTRLAKLIHFGSDGVNPYDAPQANPVHPPLNASLKVYVEYSNEIWSSGFSFPQGNWAQAQAAANGLGTGLEGKARFNARKFCETWRAFESVFGGTDRLVRVAATFTANETYSTAFVDEINAYGPPLTPSVGPDVLAVTTYFGNGIQDFVAQQGFTSGKPFDDPYWTSNTFAAHLSTAFDEWKRRIMAGDAVQGAGPDATGIGGGFSASLRDFGLPIVAYEGGPSLFTDHLDSGGSTSDDGVTIFIEAMNRDPRIADLYRIHLEIARSKGLWTHTPYIDTSPWSRFGQWGHLETLDQLPANAPKYSLMLEHFDTHAALRHIDAPLNAVPQFATAAILPVGVVGQPYATTIETGGGDGARTMTLVSAFLDPGLSASVSGSTIAISGTPTVSRRNFVLARVHDSDGDPAWRVFTLETFGGAGTLVQSDFRGASPALHRPWTPTFILSPKVTWSGWSIGGGIVAHAGDNAFVFSVSSSATNNNFLTATVTPVQGPLDLRGGEIRFSTRRIHFHAPLSYSLTTSISGQLYASSAVDKSNFDEIEHVVTIPSTTAFSAIDAPFELRIFASGAQFDGHQTSLTAFKLTQAAAPVLIATASSSTQIALTWSAVAGATYEVFRDSTQIATTASTAFVDNVAAGSAHLYRVRAVGGAFSNADLATAIIFTNDPLVPFATPIRAVHIAELRTAVNAVRTLAGLGATFDASITARATHITELRSALAAALSALGLAAPTFSSGVATSSPVLAAHFQELRAAVR